MQHQKLVGLPSLLTIAVTCLGAVACHPTESVAKPEVQPPAGEVWLTPQQVKDAFDRLAQAQNSIDTKVNNARQDADKRRSVANADARAACSRYQVPWPITGT